MELVNENTTYTTSEFKKSLEENLGFKVDLVQTDNGLKFVNDAERTNKKSRIQKVLESLGIKHKRTRLVKKRKKLLIDIQHGKENL